MRHVTIIFFVMLLFPLESVYGKSLTVLYFERPPYYETINNKADGFLVELTRQIFQNANIKSVFKEIPPLRIMHYIKNEKNATCSIGWFKNKDREKFAKFSLPIYRNKPLVVLTIQAKQHLFEPHITIKDIFSDRSLILAKIDSFSYGTIMDNWINNYSPPIHEISSDQLMLPKLIVNNRAAYMLVAPEEISMMLKKANLDESQFVSIYKPDIPSGNRRYIIFSKGVEDDLVNRINQSIQEIVHK